MSRGRRFMPVDSALHIMCRGNNRQNIFKSDRDKLYYWRLLNELKEKNKVGIFHYCLMDNHVHLVVWLTLASGLPKFMKQLNLSYYSYYKKVYGYWGHVWQGRYRSNVIEAESYLLQCGKYIELNPVRAGMVSIPEEYAFSSYRHYACGYPDAVISDSPVFLGLADNDSGRRGKYVEFVVDSGIINSNKFASQDFIGSNDFVSRSVPWFSLC